MKEITDGKDEEKVVENISPEFLLRQNTDGDTGGHQSHQTKQYLKPYCQNPNSTTTQFNLNLT